MMHLRSAVLRVPRNARSAATAPKIQPTQPRQVLRTEVDGAPEPEAFRHAPHLASRQRQAKLAVGRSLFRSNDPTPQPQPRPLLASRPSLSQRNERSSFPPLIPQSETEPSPLSRLSELKFKECGSLHSGRVFVTDANRRRTADIGHWRGKRRERDSSKRRQPKQAQVGLYIPSAVSVGQLAKILNVRLRTLQRKMGEVGMHDESSYDYVLTSDYAALLVQEFGRDPIINDEAAFDLYPPPFPENPQLVPTRPPIVAIMGHVDHGKTTLLDNLRSSSVAASEAGGITQHIGAFCVPLSTGSDSSSTSEDKRLITFLDTPGHAAFSAMRARGASVTDIVVLVVAADDGVMPQTHEVIELVKREREGGNIGMVVAINKVDKPEVDIEKTKLTLLSAGVPLEECGGDVPCVTVSGLTGSGLPELVETIALVADVMDLRAEQDCTPVGYVLESRILKGFGPVATVLVTRGTLAAGRPLLAGTSSCSTRRLFSPSLQPITSAVPGTPVLVTGWKSLPTVGEEVLAGTETEIKKACANRQRRREVETSLGDVEAINAVRQAVKEKEEKKREVGQRVKRASRVSTVVPEENSAQEVKRHLRIVVKGDVSGSVEALVGAVKDIGNNLAGVKVVSTGVGGVSDSDVMMAKATDATIVAFSVGVSRTVRASASQNHVPIYTSDIIYRVIDDIRSRVTSLLPCTYEVKVTGEATVLQLFEVQIKGSYKRIAGCRVIHGVVQRSGSVRVLRGEEIIYEGCIDALKQLRRDVTEVRKGSECGINLEEFDDLREGDVIQMFQRIEVPGEL